MACRPWRVTAAACDIYICEAYVYNAYVREVSGTFDFSIFRNGSNCRRLVLSAHRIKLEVEQHASLQTSA